MKKTPMGLKDLKPKWQPSTLNDLKRLGLKPDHAYGFRESTLKKQITKEEAVKLDKWMFGQTVMIDEPSGEHVWYTHDVIRGLDLVRHGKPTYWD